MTSVTVGAPLPPASCTTPWGTTIASGDSITTYASASVTSPTTCASVSQTRTCTNGTLGGSYTNQSCTVTAAASCTTPWGTTVASGDSVTAYQNSSVTSPGTCSSQTRTCTNGTLGGSYTNQSCTVTAPAVDGVCATTHYNCSEGTSANASATGQYYYWFCLGSGGGASPSCNEAITTAVNGSCGTAVNGRVFANGSSSYSPYPQCDNGSASNTTFPTTGNTVSWTCSGTGGGSVSPTCSASQSGASCSLPWGGAIASDYSIRAYQSSSAPCTFETRTCTNGTLSGTYTNSTCATVPTAYLTASPNPIAYGARSTLYWSSTNATSCIAGGPWSNYSIPFGSRVPYPLGPGNGWTNPLTTNTTFTFQCSGPGGTSPLQSVIVRVAIDGTCGTANSKTYTNGSSSYSSDTQCSNGSASNMAFPTAGNTVSWTCSGANGGAASPTCSASQTATPVAPTATLTASPNLVAYNGQSTLTWSSSNATNCAAGGAWSNVTPPTGDSLNGSRLTDRLTTNTTFTFQCTGPGGISALQSVTVSVGAAPVDGFCGTANGVVYANGSSSYSPNTQCASGSPSTTAFPANGSIVSWTCSGTNDGAVSPTCSASQVVNAPAVSLSPTNTSLALGQSLTYTITSSGAGMTTDSVNWMAPGQGSWNWQNSSYGATVTPGNGYTSFAATNSKTTTYSFSPTLTGTYTIYGAVLDNSGTRWTQTPNYTLTVTTPAPCTLPWGGSIVNGVSVQAFSVDSVVTPAACPASQTRTCTNGVLSGTYQNVNCIVIIPTIDTFSAIPSRVRSGGATIVSWGTTSATSCAVTRNGVAWKTGASGTKIPDTISTQTTYTIACLTGGAPMTKSITVNVVPTYYEF